MCTHCPKLESNQRPQDFQSCAIPFSYLSYNIIIIIYIKWYTYISLKPLKGSITNIPNVVQSHQIFLTILSNLLIYDGIKSHYLWRNCKLLILHRKHLYNNSSRLIKNNRNTPFSRPVNKHAHRIRTILNINFSIHK